MFKKLIVCAASALLAAVSPMRLVAAPEIGIATRDWVRSLVDSAINQAIGSLTNNVPPYNPPVKTNSAVIVTDKANRREIYTSKVKCAGSDDGYAEITIIAQMPTNRAVVIYPDGSNITARTGYLASAGGHYVNATAPYIKDILCTNGYLNIVQTNEFGVVSYQTNKCVFLSAVATDGESYKGCTYGSAGVLAVATNETKFIRFALSYSWDNAPPIPLAAKRISFKATGDSGDSGDDSGSWSTEYGGNSFSSIKIKVDSIKIKKGRREETRYIYMESLTQSINFPPEKTQHDCEIDASNNCKCKYQSDPVDPDDYPDGLTQDDLDAINEEIELDETWFPDSMFEEFTVPTADGGTTTGKGISYSFDSEGTTDDGYITKEDFLSCDAYEAALQKVADQVKARYDELRDAFKKYYKCPKASEEQHDWTDENCGNNKWKVCKRNSSHIDGTKAHEYGPHSDSHKCKCSEKRQPPNVGTWTKGTRTKTDTGWTREDTCAVDGCNEKRTVNHTCEHDECERCDVTIPEDGDAVCGEKCPTCEGIDGHERHNFEASDGTSCSVCSCSGCGLDPAEAYEKEDTFADLFDESIHAWKDGGCTEHKEEGNYSGEHCLCVCGLYDCTKETGILLHQWGEDKDPVEYFQVEGGDDDNHWKSEKGDCTRCGAKYAVKESHDFSVQDGEEPPYKGVGSNDGCLAGKKCRSGEDREGCGLEKFPAEGDADYSLTPHQKPTNDDGSDASPDFCETSPDDETKCRHWYTCAHCGESFYEDVDHDPDADNHCYCKCVGCDHQGHDFSDADECGNTVCSRCGDSDTSNEETHTGCIEDGGNHHCNCAKMSEVHVWKNSGEVVSETAAEITYKYVCVNSSWGAGGCSATKNVSEPKDPPPEPCKDEDSDDPDDHSPLTEACGCRCGKFDVSNPCNRESFHIFTEGDCKCNCKKWHKAIAREDCTGVCVCKDYKASCGSKLASSLTDADKATDDDHTEDEHACGCKCGKMTHESQDSKWHKKHPNKCRCYGASGDGDGRWHFHSPQAKCSGICSYIVNGKKHKVATSDPADESFTLASPDDHTTVTSGSYCGCECGDYYAYLDADGKLVVPEGKTQPPADSKLHRFAESGSCKCYCGAKDRPTGDGDAADKHKYASDSACQCVCGRWHRGSIKSDCPEVCGGGCDKVYKAEDFLMENGDSHKAVESNHVHVAEADKCGCKCGKYGTEEGQEQPSPEAVDLHGFSLTDGETCKCSCQAITRKASGRNFQQSLHQFLDEKCVCECQEWHRSGCNRVDDCTNICKTVDSNVFGGKTHLAQGCKVEAICEDQESDHTPLDSGITSGCGCKCFKYFSVNDDKHIWPSSGSSLHIFHDGKCYCNCRDERNPDGEQHGWSNDGTQEYPCICDCGEFHDGDPDDDCPGICTYCGRAVNDTDGENFTEAGESDHTPKADGCGCKCGTVTSDTDTDGFHHNSSSAESCTCECGSKALQHKYPSSSTCVSCYCGQGEKSHKWTDGQCKCQCGDEAIRPTGHVYVTGHCKCQCGSYTFSHVYDDSCVCQCGESTNHQYPSGTHTTCYTCYCGANKQHVYNDNSCYCACNNIFKGYHVYPAGSCVCYCGQAHDSSHPKTGCTSICALCGMLRNNHTQEPSTTDHTPKGDGCGCKCGRFGGAAYDYDTQRQYHGGTGDPACMCQCGAGHYNFTPSSCPLVCSYCNKRQNMSSATQDDHSFGATSCDCNCGKHTEHKFSDDSCECYCGESTRGHLWTIYSTEDTGTYTCNKCGNSITTYRSYYRCSRCGEYDTQEGEAGHATTCGLNVDPHLCGCGCYNCGCAACQGEKNGLVSTYGMRCTLCGKICHEKESGGGGGGGSGGETGGEGGLDDI